MKITKRQLRRIIKEEKARFLREAPMGSPIDYEARDKKDLSDIYEILVDLESELMIDSGEGKQKGDTFEQRLVGERAQERLEMVQTAIFKLESMGVAG